jgi:RPA family protein
MQKGRQEPEPALTATCRVFFDELLKSDFFIKENEETLLVTPTCARCNRLFGVGEVKEVEKRGNITRLKISDPTATLSIYTDKVIGLESTKFLAFLGNLHVRARREGAEIIKGKGILTLVEEAEPVEETVRNNWIINTARRTLERIEQLRSNLSFEGSPSIAFSNTEKKASPKKQWMKEAMEHYAVEGDKLDFWRNVAINAVKNVWLHYSKTTKGLVLELLEEAEKSSMERVKLTGELKKRGLMEEWVEEVIDELIAEGRCYEPEVEVVKVVEE